MRNYKYEMMLILMILCAIGAFYVMTIREGNDWGDDFAGYIHHTKNIAEGIEYGDTGYIYNRYVPTVGPRVYPPAYPLMLVPVYKIFGLNLKAMKIEIVIIFVVTLSIIWYIFKDKLDFKYVITMLLIIGLNPFFWEFKDNVLSDIPFMGFLYLSLLLIEKKYKKAPFHDLSLNYGLLVSFTIYLAYETRTVGGILLGCIFVYEVIVYKRPSIFLLFTTICFLVMGFIRQTFILSDASSLDYLNSFRGKSFNYLLWNAFGYLRELGLFWENGFSSWATKVVFLLMNVFACVGCIRKICLKVDIYEVFFVLYVATIILYADNQGLRYLIPIIPLYVYYSVNGVKWLGERTNWKNGIFIVVVVIIGASYMGKYMTEDFGPERYGVNRNESVELFTYIKENTGQKDVIISWKPKALALYTGRKVSIYPTEKDDTVLWTYFNEIGAKYFIIGPNYIFHGRQGIYDYDVRQPGGYYEEFIKRNNERFVEFYRNNDFKVYRRR
jgi:hypothetical protein